MEWRSSGWGILIIVILLLTGCQKQIETLSIESGYVFTDALERDIVVSKSDTVAALMGSFAEIWYLAGGELAGATDDAFEEGRLKQNEDIAILGKYNNPNGEALLALNPDLVLLSAETSAHVALRETIEQTGLNAAYFSVTHFEDYLEMLSLCTDITGRKDLYQKNGVLVNDKITEIKEHAKQMDGFRILLMITYSGGGAVQNSETMTGQMLKELGCVNIADDNPAFLKDYNIEGIIKEDPDFIFVIPMGNDDEQALKNLQEIVAANPAWNGLSAVVNNRYILLPKEMFLYKPNVRWADSYEYLFNILYK